MQNRTFSPEPRTRTRCRSTESKGKTLAENLASKVTFPIHHPELDLEEKLPPDLQPLAANATAQSSEPTPKKPQVVGLRGIMWYSRSIWNARTEPFEWNQTNTQPKTAATQ